MPNMHKLEVRASHIHGNGVYALEPIDVGEKIGTYHGQITEEDDVYVLWITDEEGREYGVVGETDLKFLNHASRPNAEFDGEDLYALAEIKPGDEITFHYGEVFEEWAQRQLRSE